MELIALLRYIDAYLNAAPVEASDVERIGPFVLFFRRDSDMPELTYARPVDPIAGDPREEIARVRSAFARRNRVCRWEFIADLAPELPGQLVECGFPAPSPRPLMVVTRETFIPATTTIAEVRRITHGETRAVERVLHEAFGAEENGAPDADTEEKDFLRGWMDRGATVAGAFVEGRPVAGGSHLPFGDTTEVAGIGTAHAYRGRGLAGALTSFLIADAFDRGCGCVFLSAADETVQRVYARLGFARIGMAMDTADMPRTE